MKKLTYKRQIILGITLLIACNVLAVALRIGAFASIAWIAFGTLFVVNPVYSESAKYRLSESGAKQASRLMGLLCALVGTVLLIFTLIGMPAMFI